MSNEERCELLDAAGLAGEDSKESSILDHHRTNRINGDTWTTTRSYFSSVIWNRYRGLKLLYLVVALSLVVVSFQHFEEPIRNSRNLFSANNQSLPDTSKEPDSPFSGAFARFPRISALPPRQKRMTIVGVWNDDTITPYLRHFFYSIQLNADHLDLLLINRIIKPDAQCLDFEKAGLNITWGGNVHVECVSNREWNRRHANFMCSEKYGWNCTTTQYEDVLKEYESREDELGLKWRPFRGYAFLDLFPNDNPFWAWMDHDVFIGNFAHYPYNILSQLSIVTGCSAVPEYLYMAGQLTAFNMDDQALGSAWKKFPAMRTADHFTKYIRGRFPDSSEERYWSFGYLGTQKDLPGTELSYCIYPDMNGDDLYHRSWKLTNTNETYVISGREVLLVSTSYTRREIEDVISIERNAPVDDFGGIGWTGGEDGSQHLLDQPSLSSAEAKQMATDEAHAENRTVTVHTGIVDDQLILWNCSSSPRWKQCVIPHPLTITEIPVMRASLVRFKEYQPGHLLRRLEIDQRPRGYERKLLKHHLKIKHRDWFDFPPFDITEEMVLRYNNDAVEVFRMGASRDETLFYRKRGEKSIG